MIRTSAWVIGPMLAMLAFGAAAQQPLQDGEIRALLLGKTALFNSGLAADYWADGTYLSEMKGGFPSRGRYSIRNGKVCVEYESEKVRCDRIMKDAQGPYLVTNSNYVDRLKVKSLGFRPKVANATPDIAERVRRQLSKYPGLDDRWAERNCSGAR